MTLRLRPMRLPDLELFEAWLDEPHFARWFLQDSTVESELADSRAAIEGVEPTEVRIVVADGRDIGWCQWYRWWDYPAEAAHYDADDGALGIDYGLGDPASIGRGLGTELIGLLVSTLRELDPHAAIIVGPSAANAASCRVLEKNGFTLRDVRDIPGEDEANPIAIYRLASPDPLA